MGDNSSESGLSFILNILQGSWETKTISVAVDIGIFTKVAAGADSVEKLSQETGIDQRVLGLLVNACGSLGLLKVKGSTVRNSSAAAEFLVAGKEGYLGDFVTLVGTDYYDAWRGFKDVVVTGKPIRDDRIVKLSNPRYAELHLKAMQGMTRKHAEELAGVLGLSGKKNVLDVGGGHGMYSVAIGKKNPGIRVTIFDSPFSCDMVKKYLDEQKARNVDTMGGDFILGSIPEGSDVIMLSHVLHTMDPPGCEALLRKVFDALPKGGVVVVNEFRLDNGGASPRFSSLFALNVFMLSNGGALYTDTQISEWITNVGFRGAKLLKTSCEFLVSLAATKM